MVVNPLTQNYWSLPFLIQHEHSQRLQYWPKPVFTPPQNSIEIIGKIRLS